MLLKKIEHGVKKKAGEELKYNLGTNTSVSMESQAEAFHFQMSILHLNSTSCSQSALQLLLAIH